MANFVRKVYKMKRNSSDILPKVEGEKCKNWMALDLGMLLNFETNVNELNHLISFRKHCITYIF